MEADEEAAEKIVSLPKESIKSERSISRKHIVFLIVVGFTSMTQGTATKGWTAVLPKMQDDPESFVDSDNDVSWLVSMTSIVGIFASLATGPMIELMGPRRSMTIALVVTTVMWLLIAYPPSKSILFIARGGIAASVSVIGTTSLPFLAELSPVKFRGTATNLSELCGSVGLLYGYLVALLFSWQTATALCTLTSALFLIPLCFVPESPYWLVRRGRRESAKRSLQRLYGCDVKADKELSAITSMPTATQASLLQQFVELRKGQNLRPVLLVLSFFVLRELGGRSCILMYTVYIFREAGVDLDAFSCTVTIGCVRLICTSFTAAILDRVGRRPVLIITSVVAAISQGLCGLFLYLQVSGASWVPLVCVIIYIAAYGTGIGPIPWVYVGELVPSPVRSLGASIITACDAITVFSINLGFLKILSHIGLGITFLGFAGLNFFIPLVVLLWIPESRGVSLQELENAFYTKTKDSVELSEEQECL